MKGHTLVAATAALAAATAIFITTASAENPSSTTNPGFVPDTGQINPGHAAQPWSAAPPLPQDQQPAQEDARPRNPFEFIRAADQVGQALIIACPA